MIFISRWYYQMSRRTYDRLNVSPILLVIMQSNVYRFFLPENSCWVIRYSIPGKPRNGNHCVKMDDPFMRKYSHVVRLLGSTRHPSPRINARWSFVSLQGKVREIPESSYELSLTSTQLIDLEIRWIMHPPKWTELNNSIQILLITVRSTRHPSPQT